MAIHIHVGKTKDSPKYTEWIIKVIWNQSRLGNGKIRAPSYYKFNHNPNMNEVHAALEKQGYFSREIDSVIVYSKK